MIWNLLSNAIKFTPKGGKVQVVLERVDSHIEITVADTGIGIRPEFLPHVFERFRQADASTTRALRRPWPGAGDRQEPGRAARRHGARRERRATGQGTTFTVHLPLAAVTPRCRARAARIRDAATQRADELVAAGADRAQVLVVDDQADARELIQRVLEDCGAEVIDRRRRGEALALIERNAPRRAGQRHRHAGCGRLRAAAPGPRARPQRGGRRAGHRADRVRAVRGSHPRRCAPGSCVHVAKPVDPTELVATVASVAGRLGDS